MKSASQTTCGTRGWLIASEMKQRNTSQGLVRMNFDIGHDVLKHVTVLTGGAIRVPSLHFLLSFASVLVDQARLYIDRRTDRIAF